VLTQGQSVWISWGPDDLYKGSAITVTPRAAIAVAGGMTAYRVMAADKVFTTAFPGSLAGSADSYFGASFTNGGPNPIDNFAVTVAVTRP
jgi:hypothetical protein